MYYKMGILTDIVISLPIGLVYNMLVHNLGEIYNTDLEYNEMIQKNLLVSFGGGLLAFVIAFSVFDSGRYKNRPIKYGLYLGSALLIFHSIGYNWNVLKSDTKFIIMSITLGILVWYAFSSLVDSDQDDDLDSDRVAATYIDYPVETFKSVRDRKGRANRGKRDD
jgi:ABC-type uncharacterized transport system permease subunit